MSGRNRGRANPNQDADEERRLWKEIRDKASDVDGMVARSNQIGAEIIEVEAQIQSSNKAALDERLEKLYRENLKLCEEVQHIIEGGSNDMNLLDSLKILAGLREASEAQEIVVQPSQGGARVASGKLNRVSKKGGTKGAAVAASAKDEDGVEQEVSSPRLRLNAGKDGKQSRSGSTIPTREASVKLENDGAESVASSVDTTTSKPAASASSANTRPSNRLVLTKGEIVFCRHASVPNKATAGSEAPEGEGILCRVTAVIGEGKQRRYEVQDADTSPTNGPPPPPQRASVSQLIKIPESNGGLADLGRGKGVMAMYPDTTTFYKAEVSEVWKGGGEKELVKLNFQDDEVAREVERRFVLMEK